MELANIIGLKKEEIELLAKNWITTVEEFISISTNSDLTNNLQNLLQVDDSRYKEIIDLLLQSSSISKINEIKKFKNNQFKKGARRP
jgi:hypothetical protein